MLLHHGLESLNGTIGQELLKHLSLLVVQTPVFSKLTVNGWTKPSVGTVGSSRQNKTLVGMRFVNMFVFKFIAQFA